MTPLRYVSVSSHATVLTWPEASQADLEDHAGPENVTAIPGGVQVRNSDGEWFTLGPGWAVVITDAGDRRLCTPGALATYYRPVPAGG